MTTDAEGRKSAIEIEQSRFELESEVKRAEIVIQRERLELEMRERGRISPLVASLLVAVVGLLGTALGASISGCSELRLARQEFEAGLIVKALEADTREQVRANLDFFLDTGLLQEYGAGLKVVSDETRPVPRIGTASIGEFSVSIQTEEQRYRVGDDYEIRVFSAEPSFIWLFSLTTGRKVAWLGESKVPERQLTARVRAVPPTGSEMFVAFASRTRIPVADGQHPFDVLAAAGSRRVAQAVRLIEVVR